MNPRRILRTGIMASAMVHLSALLVLLFFTEVHPFGSVTAEPIAVDLVPASEVAPIPKKEEPVPEKEAPVPVPEPKVKPSDTSQLPSKAEAAPQPAAPPPAAPPQPAAPRPQRQAALPTPSPSAEPQPQPQATPPAQPATPTPAYVPPEPDLSVKYHVMLGLPPALPAQSAKGPGEARAATAAH
jgi:hypothetical protein